MPPVVSALSPAASIDARTILQLEPKPLLEGRRQWSATLGGALSLLIFCAVAWQLRTINLPDLAAMLPSSGAFWLTFTCYFLAGPALEWCIYRRLWSLPAIGFPALLRKLISNEMLLSYSGEVYFYDWARRHLKLATSPFAAIKDVAMLSALVGNVVTIILVLAAAPLFRGLSLGTDGRHLAASIAVVIASSTVILVLRRRLFSLSRPDLRFVIFVHTARIVTTTLLAATLWHLLLPTVALEWWIVLAATRLLLSRLPFMPNHDVVFAGVATFLVGATSPIADAVTLVAATSLAGLILCGLLLGTSSLARTLAR